MTVCLCVNWTRQDCMQHERNKASRLISYFLTATEILTENKTFFICFLKMPLNFNWVGTFEIAKWDFRLSDFKGCFCVFGIIWRILYISMYWASSFDIYIRMIYTPIYHKKEAHILNGVLMYVYRYFQQKGHNLSKVSLILCNLCS